MKVAVAAIRSRLAMVAVIGLLGFPAWTYADGLGLKPGLWEVRLVRQIVDGHDVSQQLTESIAKGQTALARLPPQARAQVQSMLNDAQAKPGSNASFRICISAQVAADDLPILDKDNSCRPESPAHAAGHTTFRIDCTLNGTRIQGRGDAVSSGEVITTHTTINSRTAQGSMQSMQNETQMSFIGARCEHLASEH